MAWNSSRGSISLSASNGGFALLHTNLTYGHGAVEFTLSASTTVDSDVYFGWSGDSSFDGTQPSVHINIGDVLGVVDVQLWNPPGEAATGFLVPVGQTHVYRLVCSPSSVELYVDGELKTTETSQVPTGQNLQLWVRVSADPGVGNQATAEVHRVRYWDSAVP